jgi:hypothetical protein
MIESEWQSCDDPRLMLEFLRGKASERKLRLFAVACYRRVPGFAALPEVAVAERLAEGLVTEEELAEARAESARGDEQSVGQFSYVPPPESILLALGAGLAVTASPAADAAKAVSGKAAAFVGGGELLGQAGLLREIIGNAFRPASINPDWLTPTVTGLAAAAYEERDLPSGHLDAGRLGVLADALEDAGCDDTEILDHCRGQGPHVRGCWVVDLLLGKE